MSMTEAEMRELGLVPIQAETEDEEQQPTPVPQPVESLEEAGFKRVKETPVTRQELYGDLIEREQELKTETVDPFGFIEEELGRREPLAPRREELEAEKEARYREAVGPEDREVAITEEGTRVLIPTPAMADDPMLVMGARATSELGRGLAATFGMLMPGVTAEEMERLVPTIRDESDLVNVGSEAIQLIVGAGTGAAGAAKLMTSVLKNAPRAYRTIAAIVGAPVGEAAVATEQTGTITGDEDDTVLQRKLRVLAEGAAFGTTLEVAGKAIKTIADLSPMARIMRALPTAMMGTREGAERMTGDTLADLIARTENATTPEDRIKALEDLQKRISENFEAQTGVNFKDYVEGRVELPEGVFEPTLGGVAGTDVLARVERGIAQREGLPEFTGRFESQRKAMETEIPRAVEQTIPTVQRVEGETAEQAAERLGAEAREEVGAVVTRRTEPERIQVETLQKELDDAVAEVEAKFAPEAEATFAGLQQSRANQQVANNAAESATETVETVYIAQRKAKNDLYEKYLEDADKIEIPADEFETALASITDPAEIAEMSKLVASANPAYGRVLKQLSDQRKRLDRAIEDQINEQVKDAIQGLKGKAREDAAKKARAEAVVDMDAAKKAANYQDVKLSNLEGLLQAVNSVQARTGTEIGAVNLLKDGLEASINKAIGTDEALRASRQGAIQYFQNFQDLYKTATGSEIVPNFRFGDKISDQQFKQAQAGLTSVLKDAGSDPAKLQFLNDLRATMDEKTLAEFNDSLAKFYKHDIYGSVKYDPTSQLARNNPQGAAQALSAGFTRALAKYPNLEQLAPGIVDEITTLAKTLDQSAGDVATARSALDQAQTRLDDAIKEAEATPEAIFSRPAYTTSATKAVKRLIMDEDSIRQFPQIWQTAGQAGRKGADGLTDAQRKLKVTVAQGTMELIYPAAARGKKTGELNLAKIDQAIERNPVFETVFPKGSPDREVFDILVERTRAIAKRDVRAISGESATATIENVGQLVSELINYVEGPLSQQGRRSKILSRTFFKLAGGPEQAQKVLTETFLDPRLANRLIEEAKERVRMTGENFEEAKVMVLGAHLLTRFGVRTVEELNNEVQNVILETETEEALPTE